MPIIGQKIQTSSANFGNMVQNGCLLVDKTLMIKEFIDGEEVSLITRMRRSGKSLNMSMLQHFFAEEVDGAPTKGLFDQFAIAKENKGEFVEKHQGKYPVIFVTFKDIKESSYGAAVNQIRVLIQKLYRAHEEILKSDKLSPMNKEIFTKYLSGSVNNEELQIAIEFLSEILHKTHGKKVIILVDEYDTPLTQSYQHKYLEQLSDFMRNIFSSAFKDNSHLAKGLMTGILRVSKNNMLSGLNNLKVYTSLDRRYDQYFGFTEEEVAELVIEAGVTDGLADIKSFYNGYQIGNTVIYNPWSMMNYLAEKQLSPYWVLTSNDNLLKDVLIRSDGATRKKLESLMQGEEISGEVNVNLRYEDLIERPDALWTLLVFCGYLTVTSKESSLDYYVCKLRIPNQEVLIQYKSIFIGWLKEKLGADRYDSFLKSLVKGEVEEFTRILGDYLMESLSFMDVTGDKKSESFYHGFVAAIIAGLRETHYINSNKESGLGRYDILITPKNVTNPISIILEFKHAKKNQDIEVMAKAALQQINDLKYDTEIKRHSHITKVIKVGLAFGEKSVVSAYQEEDMLTQTASEPQLFKLQREEEDIFSADIVPEEKLSSSISNSHQSPAIAKRPASSSLVKIQNDKDEVSNTDNQSHKKQRHAEPANINRPTLTALSGANLGIVGFFPAIMPNNNEDETSATSAVESRPDNDNNDDSNYVMGNNNA